MGMLNHTAKYSFAIVVVTGVILIGSSFARMRLQQASTGFQASQTERDAVAYFKLENVAGGFMTREDLKGKVAVVDLWATWCTPCVEEIPIYNRLYDAFEGQDVAIVGIAVDSPPLRDIPSKVRKLGIKYPVLIGDDKASRAFGGVDRFPTTVVISKEGKIYKRYLGTVANKEQKIKEDIEHLTTSPVPK
jgi:thiol-disulfide isomerase/thioredoxin